MYQMIGSPLINLTSQLFEIDIPAYSTLIFIVNSLVTFFQFYSNNGFGKKKVYLHRHIHFSIYPFDLIIMYPAFCHINLILKIVYGYMHFGPDYNMN